MIILLKHFRTIFEPLHYSPCLIPNLSSLDSPGIGNPALIESLQEKAQIALEDYLRHHSSTHFSNRYGKLLLRLPALSLLRPGTIESMFFPDLFGENTIDSFVGSVLVCGQQTSPTNNNNNDSLVSLNINDGLFVSSNEMSQQFEMFASNNQGSSFMPETNLSNNLVLNSLNEIQLSNLPNIFHHRGGFGDLAFGVSPAACIPSMVEGGDMANSCNEQLPQIFNQVLPDHSQQQKQG